MTRLKKIYRYAISIVPILVLVEMFFPGVFVIVLNDAIDNLVYLLELWSDHLSSNQRQSIS